MGFYSSFFSLFYSRLKLKFSRETSKQIQKGQQNAKSTCPHIHSPLLMPQIVHMQRPNSKNIVRLHPSPNNLQSNLIILLNNRILLSRFIARRVAFRVKLHVAGYRVAGDEAGHGADFGVNADFVDLGDRAIDHLVFEGLVDDGFVLDRVLHKASARQNNPTANAVNVRNSHNKPILSSTSSLNFSKQLLLNRLDQFRPKVPRMQQDLVFEGNDVEHVFRSDL